MPPFPDLLGSIRKHWCCFASSPPATPPPQPPTICSTEKSLNVVGGEGSDAKMVCPQFSKSSPSDCASTESSAWRSLPDDILDRALALLPLPEVFRLRRVCKRWNALIQCAQFQEWSLRCPVPWGPFYLPWVRRTEREWCVAPWFSYDFAQEKWICMPQFKFPLLNRTSSWSVVTGNEGLVCFGSGEGRQILVCNPLTNMWKELPSGRLDSKSTAISCMIFDEQRTSYKILFAGNDAYKMEDPRYGTVDLYDSISNTWSIGQNLSICYHGLTSGAYCNGEFYALTWLYHKDQPNSCVVVKLDLTTMRWREETTLVLEGLYYVPVVVACLGRIYLMGARYDMWVYPFGGIVIYQLDQSNGWTKVSELSLAFFYFLGLLEGFWSNGSKIHVVKLPWVVVYNCATNGWELPICTGARDDPNMKMTYQPKFLFQPNLQVAP